MQGHASEARGRRLQGRLRVHGSVGGVAGPDRARLTHLRPAAASADTASAIGVVFAVGEVQAILTELRDLKAKLRAAGLLAP